MLPGRGSDQQTRNLFDNLESKDANADCDGRYRDHRFWSATVLVRFATEKPKSIVYTKLIWSSAAIRRQG